MASTLHEARVPILASDVTPHVGATGMSTGASALVLAARSFAG